jgi:nucleoside-diphosphate-sugar epimerase
MKIFLTGAGGFIGSHLIKHLSLDGHKVTGVVRSLEDEDKLKSAGMTVVRSNLFDPIDLSNSLSGHDVVIHCAAYVRLWGPQQLFQDSNVRLTQALIVASQALGIQRFIYMSAACVVMNTREALYKAKEDLPVCERDELPYTQSKAMAEKIVLAANTPQFQTLALRPALVWGRGDVVDQYIGQAANEGRFGWFNQGQYPYSTCYIGNLCEAVSLALRTQASGEAIFVADEEIMDLRNFMSQRLEVSNYRIPTFSIARSVAWPLARFTENGWKYLPLKGEPPLVREAVRTMAYPFTVSIEKAQRLLSYQPPFTISQGFGAMNNKSSY